MKKTFGIIGAGNIAQAVAKHLLHAGHEVILSNTNQDKLVTVVNSLGEGAKAGSLQEAAGAAVVVLALPWLKVPELAKVIPYWGNSIVIDATNHFISADFKTAELNGRNSSEVVTDSLPGARVVKAFNTLYYKVLEQEPVQEEGGRRVLFLSGDHAEANAEVAALIESLGFAAVDLGKLSEGGMLQQAKSPLAALNLIRLK